MGCSTFFLFLQLLTLCWGAAADSTTSDYTAVKRATQFKRWVNKDSTWAGGLSNKTWGSINQTQQNGQTSWGTGSLNLPLFRADGGTYVNPQTGFPWNNITTTNSNPYTSSPGLKHTGVTRKYTFNIAHCNIAPDGVTANNSICINGQFPGPLIEANYGDTISVTVYNKLLDQGTSMHWHGLLQTQTPAHDGVVGSTQCPIAPGTAFTYQFTATLYGSSWYHAHYSAQYTDGVVGPIVIYGPEQASHDFDVGPVMLADQFHSDYPTLMGNMMRPLAKGGPIKPLASNVLINGKSNYPCSKTSQQCSLNAGLARFNFTSGAIHKLRLMNIGSASIQKFSIDGHIMQVIANDFVPIVPYNTSMLALSVGQRADVLVYGNGTSGSSYYMRSSIAGCSINDGTSTEGLASIYYQGADTSKYPTTSSTSPAYLSQSPQTCANDPLQQTVPAFPIPAATPDVTDTFNITAGSNGTHIVFFFGGISHRANYSVPVMQFAYMNDTAILKNRPSLNIKDYGTNGTVRVILYNYEPEPHPMHLHGHNVQVLAQGMGKWDGSSIVRPPNPARRDVQTMFPAQGNVPSYTVLQWWTDRLSYGVWGFHCHFAWHASLGFYMNIIEQPAAIVANAQYAAQVVKPGCDSWNQYSSYWGKPGGMYNAPVDSGIKLKGKRDDISIEGKGDGDLVYVYED